MFVYNSLTRRKEELAKTKKKIKLFVCGPTVYNYIHLGNTRTYIAFDIIARVLRAMGYRIFYLQNITDVDDKIIAAVQQKNKKPLEEREVNHAVKSWTNFYYRAYRKTTQRLGIETVDRYARASDFIPQIVRQIKTLIKKELAYKIDGDGYYFNIAKFPAYGRLSGRTVLQAEDATSRIDESVTKINRGDFCLWKFRKPGEPFWRTELGEGRPGWHIEDTAITEKFFGPQYDIHGGGIDLKFPHHEAEIAQQEGASGKTPFVKIWMHAGFLYANGEKMAKSRGNFITADEFLKKHPAEVLRMMVASHHYRSPVNFTPTLVTQAVQSAATLKEFRNKLAVVIKKRATGEVAIKVDLPAILRETKTNFWKSLEDDFNTPRALAALFGLVSVLQKDVWRIRKSEARLLLAFLDKSLATMGFAFKEIKIPKRIIALSRRRETFRSHQQFLPADRLRKKILELGYEIEDTPYGPWLKPI